MADLIAVRSGGNRVLLNLDQVRYVEEQVNEVTGLPQDVVRVVFLDGTWMMVRESLDNINRASLEFDYENQAAANSSV